MIYRKTLIPSILYLSFAILVQPVSASSPAEKDLMDGYVRDGLHCEANANFLGAIHAYTNATDNNPKDRCAWVRLAKAYRASDQFYKGWLAQYESRQNEQAAEHSLFYVRPAIVYTQEYTPHSGWDSSEFGYYWNARKSVVPSKDSRIIHEDKTLCAKIGEESSLYRLYERYVQRGRPTPVTFAEFEASIERSKAAARKVFEAQQRKDLAWKSLEGSNRDDAAIWLELGLACADCRADEGAAALHVVLLSNPDKAQAEQAQLALSKYWAHTNYGPPYLIAPDQY